MRRIMQSTTACGALLPAPGSASIPTLWIYLEIAAFHGYGSSPRNANHQVVPFREPFKLKFRARDLRLRCWRCSSRRMPHLDA
jgi:hypothetical protein